MKTGTLQIFEKALGRIRHGFPSFEVALKYKLTAPEDVWQEVDDLVMRARLEHDGGPDLVPPIPCGRAKDAPLHERFRTIQLFTWWRLALEDAHHCISKGLPWEDGPDGSGLTRPQAITMLCTATLLAHGGMKGLDVQPGEVEARARLPAQRMGAFKPWKRDEMFILGERFPEFDEEQE